MLHTCDIGIETQGIELEDNLHFPQMEKLNLRLPNFVLFDSLDIPSLKSLSVYLDTPPRQLTPISP